MTQLTQPADSSSPMAVLDTDTASRLSEIFAAMADPNRLRIISALSHHELSVSELSKLVDMTKSATSHQLRLLRTLRIVRARKAGRQVFYFLHDDHIHDLLDRGIAHIQHE
jgi:ArsR family transcriptional regulator, lead/cadmium/zinc/bismuth-responsive transcriptional repressor